MTKASPFDRYQRATIEAYQKFRVIGLSIGEPGARKTSFWLEAPGPIVSFSFDRGLEGVVDRVLKEQPDKEIYVKEYNWSPRRDQDFQEQAKDLRDQFEEDFDHAIANARTVILDKENDLWELYRYAEFGPEANEAPRNYPALNQRYREMINKPKDTDINFGLIEGMRDEWGSMVKKSGAQGAAATGRRIRQGFKELDGLVHVCLLHTGLGPADWAFEVGKVRGAGAINVAGQTFQNLTFPEFSQLLFPESDESCWV